MISSIYIDGYALWVVIAAVILAFAGAVVFGCGYTAAVRENGRLRRELALDRARRRSERSEAYRSGIKSGLCVKGTAEKEDGNVQM